MANSLPPVNDAILTAVAQLVDDSQTSRRDPSHEQLSFCIERAGLTALDPNAQGQPLGKAKRVRAVLSRGLEQDFTGAQRLTQILLEQVRGFGGFRTSSSNYVGAEAISNLQDAFKEEGFVLTAEGGLFPQVLDSLSGAALTEALQTYVRRAQRGAEDAALLTGTGKDLVEATAAHVLVEVWSNTNPPHVFPALLGQAFVALGLKTSQDKTVSGEPAQHSLHRSLFDAACAVNRLRNKQGTGHGRPWLPSVTDAEARVATQVMGSVARLLLDALEDRS